MYLPREWTYSNTSFAGDDMAQQKTAIDAGSTNWIPQSTATKVGIIIVHNDAIAGTADATMQARYLALRLSLIAAGCNKIVAVKMHTTIGGTAAALNAYYDTLIGLGLADKVVTPGVIENGDGIHPTTAGHYALYQAIWAQGLSSFYNSARWRGSSRASRCR
jgi:hypothetical protein